MNKREKKKLKDKAKRAKSGIRLPPIPPNKRHKSKKTYKRNNKVKSYEIEKD